LTAFIGCATSHPEKTWPPELDISCEHPVVIGMTTAVYGSLSNSKGGPYIVNPPYATDISGARTESWPLDTAAHQAGGEDALLHGLDEMPSETAALSAATADTVVTAAPAIPFFLWHEYFGGLSDLRLALGSFGHVYSRQGGTVGCPCNAESNETVKGYVFLPARHYTALNVEVDDPNLVGRSVTAKCAIN
jgi:hypothetical protein